MLNFLTVLLSKADFVDLKPYRKGQSNILIENTLKYENKRTENRIKNELNNILVSVSNLMDKLPFDVTVDGWF